MHIPDGYLSPATCAVFGAIMVPIWTAASRSAGKTLKVRQVPYLAIGAAFSFVIMMFNVPIPGGSTGHAVGGVLVAILLGPWAACIAVTVALLIQALLFGDGGITAFGANCFNLAFVLPFTGYYVYRFIAYDSTTSSGRRIIAAGAGAYAGICMAALTTGIQFGVQPALYHTSNGQALYSPYGLHIAVPAMLVGHLVFFGWVEAIVTALAVKYLQQEGTVLFNGDQR
ncbi:cobalt transporter CbiM [Pelodictyon luteolum]|uniref:Cobalamin biosynthesis protein CbiM n=1 Tax=Chlorobium luteolum (strain DSM 273 / BCRC 81028 / 2530) TaxID=319225 RepID=Q3B2X2_CHLL3|nr:cobalt transporter CbiM [Pelodictyon luteolum]ABB24309.1 Cobalamin biosynthesis protein CbiM [Pelodictyon luteolum DSM 273]